MATSFIKFLPMEDEFHNNDTEDVSCNNDMGDASCNSDSHKHSMLHKSGHDHPMLANDTSDDSELHTSHLNFQSLKEYGEVAVVFSKSFKTHATGIYDELTALFPEKELYLIPSHSVICPLKLDDFQAYVIVGTPCPLHPFSPQNSVQFKIGMPDKFLPAINGYNGNVIYDPVYILEGGSQKGLNTVDSDTECGLADSALIVTENQALLDYYSTAIENVISADESLKSTNKVSHLMKEHSNAEKIHQKKAFLVIFTHRALESVAVGVSKKLKKIANAYVAFLKDISYERLISMDNIDCIVLVDCRVFKCTIRTHIPVISLFSFEIAMKQLDDIAMKQLENREHEIGTTPRDESKEIQEMKSPCDESKEIRIHSGIAELMVNRAYQGVPYGNDQSTDTCIHKGQTGIASKYQDET